MTWEQQHAGWGHELGASNRCAAGCALRVGSGDLATRCRLGPMQFLTGHKLCMASLDCILAGRHRAWQVHSALLLSGGYTAAHGCGGSACLTSAQAGAAGWRPWVATHHGWYELCQVNAKALNVPGHTLVNVLHSCKRMHRQMGAHDCSQQA